MGVFPFESGMEYGPESRLSIEILRYIQGLFYLTYILLYLQSMEKFLLLQSLAPLQDQLLVSNWKCHFTLVR